MFPSWLQSRRGFLRGRRELATVAPLTAGQQAGRGAAIIPHG